MSIPYSKVKRKCEQLHEAIESFFYTDTEAIMNILNYISCKEFNEIRKCYYEMYGTILLNTLSLNLLYQDFEIIKKRIIPDSKSPLLWVIIGILSYAAAMYLILYR